MRTPIIAGNWKMNKTVPEAIEACRKLDELVAGTDVEVVVCAPFTALSPLAALGMSHVKLAAQNMYHTDSGAYTGEISPLMLKDLGCQYVILGHSERREIFNEDDSLINAKVITALKHGLCPIICVGETLEQRKAGQTNELVINQVKKAYSGVSQTDALSTVIAYEPIWAIGTGETASAEDANAVISTIRKVLVGLYGKDLADRIRIQYGGSVKPANIKELMAQSDIDGALVGGASLNPEDFASIVKY